MSLPSPGLINRPGAAFELKIRLPLDLVATIEHWASTHLQPDPHGIEGRYRTTSLYYDTPRLDVYHRGEGHRRSKYRLRRYGESEVVFLERKTREGDRVWKQRDAIGLQEVGLLNGTEPSVNWVGGWFLSQLRDKDLRPTCRVSYLRTAFIGGNVEHPVRLTMDRELCGMAATDWDLTPVQTGKPLLPDSVVLEMKYRDTLPGLFRELLAQLPPDLGRVSKYRLCVRAWGLAGEGT